MTTRDVTPATPDAPAWRCAVGALGGALALTGAAVLGAWACGEPAYLQFVPSRPPLGVPAAPAFLAWGGAYLALARGRVWTARALGAALAALGIAAALGTVARVGTGALAPAGLPPALSGAFALAGLALARSARAAGSRAGAAVLAGAVLAVGVPVAAGAPSGGLLVGPSGVPLLGAAGAWVGALGLLGWWVRAGAPAAVLGRALPAAVGAVGAALTFAMWMALDADQDERVLRQVQFEAGQVQRVVADRFAAEVARLAELAEKHPAPPFGTPVPERALRAVGDYDAATAGCVGVIRVDGDSRAGWVWMGSPSAPAEPKPPSNPGPFPVEELGGGEALGAAVRDGRPAVVRPRRVAWHGQRVLLLFAPHRPRDGRGGFVVVLSEPQLYASTLNANVAVLYAVTVTDGEERLFARFGAVGRGERWTQTLPLDVYGNRWALTVAPTPDALARDSLSVPRLGLLAGLVLTTLLALAVHLAQTARFRTFALENEMRERKLAESALRQSEAKYRTLIENLGQGVFLLDAEHRYVAVNGPFCERVGRSEGDILGRTDADLFDPERAARRADEVRVVLAEGRGVESESETVVDERRTCVRRVLTPVRDAAGRVTGVLGICWDVTQQRQLEAHVNQASKMDAIGQLAGGIAHDFNNLLTVILGSLEVLLADAPTGNPEVPLLTSAQSAGQRAAALTQRLLGFARRHQLDWRPTSINGVVAEVVALLQRTIDPLTRIETDLDPDLWPVESDPTQLNQVLMNLCLNARDAIGGAGVIGISTACVTGAGAAGPGDVSPAEGEYVRLRVTDTGAGMPPEVKARMFEPFFTTKGVGKGTGLGLAMVFAIVRQHKGWIDCASEVGAGTRFDIYLPRGGAAKPFVSAPAPLPVRRAGQGTVLVVDDEELIRALAAAALQAAGYNVLQAADGQEAVGVYTRERDHIDLVLLDLTMPVLSGHEAFRQLVALNPRVKVLIASGYSTEQLSDLEREKMAGFVKKPYRPSELVAAVDDALPGRSGFRLPALSGAR